MAPAFPASLAPVLHERAHISLAFPAQYCTVKDPGIGRLIFETRALLTVLPPSTRDCTATEKKEKGRMGPVEQEGPASIPVIGLCS
jgi:hypothetical protein